MVAVTVAGVMAAVVVTVEAASVSLSASAPVRLTPAVTGLPAPTLAVANAAPLAAQLTTSALITLLSMQLVIVAAVVPS